VLTLPIDDVLGSFARAAAAHPEVGFFRTYACEIQMWAGRYAAARAELASVAAATKTRWAYIGLGAAAVLDEDAEAAERAWREGAEVYGDSLPGEATASWRGEIALRAGALDDATRHLEHAVTVRPLRLRAWLLLALARDARGDRDGSWDALRHAVGVAPGAALRVIALTGARALRDHLERELSPPPAATWAEAVVAVEHWLERLRGNASSVVHSWHDGDDSHDGVVATDALDADSLLRGLDTWEEAGKR
jgi:hypothetical protein